MVTFAKIVFLESCRYIHVCFSEIIILFTIIQLYKSSS